MKKTILFSPVGGTDPISWNNFSDGSLLHICRYYHPNVIYLYMSKEILKLQEQDNRYRYCLNKLMEQQKRSAEIIEIPRPDLDNVQDFNYFFEDFTKELQKISSKLAPDDVIILNVSSGTPAMKSGLLVMATLGEYNWKAIQVVTPTRAMNEHTHKGYDVKEAWELDQDNEEGAENRCQEIHCPNLLVIKHEENIKELIREYDYTAAETLAKSLPEEISSSFIPLIQMANARILLDTPTANKISRQLGCDSIIPIRDAEKGPVFEYALVLQIRMRQHAYSDFVRGLTPVIAYLFEDILKNQLHIDIEPFVRTDRKNVRRWSFKTEKEELFQALSSKYSDGFTGNNGPIYSDHLATLIEYYGTATNLKLVETVKSIREIELSIRNRAAHTITSVTDETIKRETGYCSEEIMNRIRKLFKYSSLPVKEIYWDSYDQMNEYIISRM